MLTIVIPTRNELYLNETVDEIFKKAMGEIEVILVLDNCWNAPLPEDRPNLTIVHWGGRRGMRAAINAGLELGKGSHILKCDAHCMFDEGFDVKLAADCDDDWVVTPIRYGLDADKWEVRKDKPPVQYEYLSYPYDADGNQVGLHAKYWWSERDKARKAYEVDENMAWQGSCWFMPMPYARKLIYPMDEKNYGMFIGEPQEIGLKVWLSGGKNMLNKKTWYAHLWKGEQYRQKHIERMGFPYTRVGKAELIRGNNYSVQYWFHERRAELQKLVDRFAPVPGWS